MLNLDTLHWDYLSWYAIGWSMGFMVGGISGLLFAKRFQQTLARWW